MRRSGRAGAATTALAIVAAVLGACAASCKGHGGAQDGMGAAGRGVPDSGAGGTTVFGPMCAGTSNVAGTVPAGTFTSGLARAVVLGSTCKDPPAGSVQVVFQDTTTLAHLRVTLPAPGDAGGPPVLGPQTAAATFEPPGAATVKTTGEVVVSRADDPRTSVANDGGARGTISGTVSFVRDGLTLSGSFSTPYCQELNCLGH